MANNTTEKEVESSLTDKIHKILHRKLQWHIANVIQAHLVDAFHQEQKKKVNKKVTEDEAPTNCMGAGQIATFDPMLFVKMAKRKKPNANRIKVDDAIT